MPQRQPRLGDILDDYCPRERRLTNHVVVAMIGEDIRLTRCTTCDAEHDYKHARVPRLRKKSELTPTPPLGMRIPKRVVQEPLVEPDDMALADEGPAVLTIPPQTLIEADEADGTVPAVAAADEAVAADFGASAAPVEEGPVHRQLIRAQLPRQEGQPPTITRQAPDFTIRQPTGRPNRFRFRQQRNGDSGDGMFSHGGQGSRGGGNANGNVGGNGRGIGPRSSGRPPLPSRATNRQGGGRKRSK